jgi:hypothetical protein
LGPVSGCDSTDDIAISISISISISARSTLIDIFCI